MSKKLANYISFIAMLLGGIVCLAIYGDHIVNPHFLIWLREGDPLVHFVGWKIYRFDHWMFPLGAMKNYAYPQITSIVATDSIPLFALFFKLLSPILPLSFQYFGIWLVFCYLCQGYLASRLLGKITDHPILIWLGSLLFILPPIIVRRAVVHNSLAGQWIILYALYLYLSEDHHKNRIQWIILLVMSVLIHFYLFAMALIIFIAYLAKLKFTIHPVKTTRSIVIFLTTTTMIILLVMWGIGYFNTQVKALAYGYNVFSMNLVAPIDPQNFPTLFLKPLSVRKNFEGFNYLGLGVILLILLAIYELSKKTVKAIDIKPLIP